MSEKTFKALHATGKELVVESNGGDPKKEFYLHTTHKDGDFFAIEDAPAIALAILEAAGYEDTGLSDNHVGCAMLRLRNAIAKQEAAKREAEYLKALDAEAQQYYFAAWGGGVDYKGYHTVDDEAKTYWRNIAIKAREIHGASK